MREGILEEVELEWCVKRMILKQKEEIMGRTLKAGELVRVVFCMLGKYQVSLIHHAAIREFHR
jgi:hypothetical protein